jgi:hypothetical protein
MASRKNFPGAKKRRLEGVAERLTRAVESKMSAWLMDDETRAQKLKLAKEELEKVQSKIGAIN